MTTDSLDSLPFDARKLRFKRLCVLREMIFAQHKKFFAAKGLDQRKVRLDELTQLEIAYASRQSRDAWAAWRRELHSARKRPSHHKRLNVARRNPQRRNNNATQKGTK